ncbi:MAG TPA: hypothetical protein PKC65_01675 [Pyrinomonadaceae bacterium]|nr:hypothetical protein [Pyrinomonadaceae bacterium]
MKNILKHLHVQIVMTMAISLISVSGVMAQTPGSTDMKSGVSDCVKVSLVADSNLLEKEGTTSLNVKIENVCASEVRVSEPSFVLEKPNIGKKLKSGDKRVARIVKENATALDNSLNTIESGRFIEFNLYTRDLRWKDSISSIDVFQDLFTDLNLTIGMYNLYAMVSIERCVNENDKPLQKVTSNKLEMRFEG